MAPGQCQEYHGICSVSWFRERPIKHWGDISPKHSEICWVKRVKKIHRLDPFNYQANTVRWWFWTHLLNALSWGNDPIGKICFNWVAWLCCLGQLLLRYDVLSAFLVPWIQNVQFPVNFSVCRHLFRRSSWSCLEVMWGKFWRHRIESPIAVPFLFTWNCYLPSNLFMFSDNS